MLRDKVPFNRAGKVNAEKGDTFGQKDKHLKTMAGEIERGRVVRHVSRGLTRATKPTNNTTGNVYPATSMSPKGCETDDMD